MMSQPPYRSVSCASIVSVLGTAQAILVLCRFAIPRLPSSPRWYVRFGVHSGERQAVLVSSAAIAGSGSGQLAVSGSTWYRP